MSNVRITLLKSGIKGFLKSEEVANCVLDAAQSVANRAGDGYEAEVKNTPGRKIASVSPKTYKARRDLYKNNTLEKAVRSK